MVEIGTVYSKTVTATADTPFAIENEGGENYLQSTNIHCYTNDAYYGNQYSQPGIIKANACVWFEGVVKVSDLRFKNYAAGSNTVISIVGILVKGDKER